MKEKTLLIGFDPSFTNTGVCILDPSSKKMQLKTADFDTAIKWAKENCDLRKVIAFVENPDMNSPTFKMWGLVQAKINGLQNYNKQRFSKVVPHVSMADVQQAFSIAMKRAQDVGQNKAAAKYLIAKLTRANIPVVQIAPSAREKAYIDQNGKKQRVFVKTLKMPTKTTQAQFEELTGHKESTSEHARDAATLIWGRTIQNAITILIAQDDGKQAKRPSSIPGPGNFNYSLFKNEQ